MNESTYKANLINELHRRRYTIDGLSDNYNTEILNAIRKFRDLETSVDEEKYFEFTESDPRMNHVAYDEFKSLIELQEKYEKLLEKRPVGRESRNPGGEEGKMIRDRMRMLTNRALVRRLSQDMCEDVNVISKGDYKNLYVLGYRGNQDVAIPEIVRGNFNMYVENQMSLNKINRCQEIMDRIEVFLRYSTPKTSVGKQEYLAKRYLMGEVPISEVRSRLKELHVKPFVDYREKYLEEFYNENFEKARKVFDVYNDVGRIQKELMDGNTETKYSTYKQLSDLGYNGKEGHPLIRSGYEMFVNQYVYDKVIAEYSDEIEDMCWEMRDRRYAVDLLEAQREIPNSVNAVSSLVCDIAFQIAKGKYNRGKIGKEDYDKAKKWKDYMDRNTRQQEIPEAIHGVKDVDTLRKRNNLEI